MATTAQRFRGHTTVDASGRTIIAPGTLVTAVTPAGAFSGRVEAAMSQAGKYLVRNTHTGRAFYLGAPTLELDPFGIA